MQNSCFFSRVFFSVIVLSFIIALSGQKINTNVCADCKPYTTQRCLTKKDFQDGKVDSDNRLEDLKDGQHGNPFLDACVPDGSYVKGNLQKALCIADRDMGCTLVINNSLVKTKSKEYCEWCYTECGCKKLLKPPTKAPTTKKKKKKNSAAIKSVVLASYMTLTYISSALYEVINKIV